MEPDYGIDIDLELFDYEENVCVTLGEHVFLQVKGTEVLEHTVIRPVGKQIYSEKELAEMQIPVVKVAVDVPLLKLVERMGSAIPVLLTVVDIKEQVAYYVCLNDYVRNVLPYRAQNYKDQGRIIVYIPKENILSSGVVSWYGKRAKLYGLFQELLTLADDVGYLNADHKVDLVLQRLKMIALSDAWSTCKYWPALRIIKKQMDEMLGNNMLNEAGKRMIAHLVEEKGDPSSRWVQYGTEPIPINALLAGKAISCDAFLDQAKAVGAMFENNARHIGLPTQVNWMLTHQ
jgi:hypothetical protein